jgi:enoyl-CoA hydratase
MKYANLILEKEDGIGILTMNRPEALNALNMDVLKDLKQAVADIAADDEIKALIITGAGKAFVAGADIKAMQPLNPVQARNFGIFGHTILRDIEKLEIPVIAAINGFALGGGCELAMAADIRLASEKAKFGQPEVGLGITPGFGGTQRLPRIVGEGIARELIFTADVIDAQEAYRVGLVNHVYPADTLLDEARKMAVKIAKKAPVAVKLSKAAINRGMQVDIDTALNVEADLFSICFATRDQKSGMEAFLNKARPEYKGE